VNEDANVASINIRELQVLSDRLRELGIGIGREDHGEIILYRLTDGQTLSRVPGHLPRTAVLWLVAGIEIQAPADTLPENFFIRAFASGMLIGALATVASLPIFEWVWEWIVTTMETL